MKTAPIKTKCPCGAELTGQVPKPKFLQKTIVKLKCEECESRFMLKCKLAKGGKSIDFEAQAIEITQRSKDIVSVDLGMREPG